MKTLSQACILKIALLYLASTSFSYALEDFAKVIQVKRGTKVFMQQDYRCEEKIVTEQPRALNRDRAEKALIGGAIAYGLGHNSQYRGEIATLGAAAGWASESKQAPVKRGKRVCGNVLVPQTYPDGWELIVEYRGEKKLVQTDKKYEVGDLFPIQVSWQ